MDDGPLRRWQTLTSAGVEELARRDPVVVLPLAAIEQHGPHLPLSTDLEIGRGLLARAFGRLPDDFPARVLPPQAVGSSAEHGRFPGTLSLSPELLGEIVHAHGVALARAGIRRLVLSTSHGGNRSVMDAAALRLRERRGLLVVKADYARFPRPPGIDLPEAEWRHGLHGGAVETSMMLHLRPDLVRRDEIRKAPSLGEELEEELLRLSPDGEPSFAWLAEDLHPSGVTGDPRLAGAELGERLVDHYGALLAEVLRDARAFPLDRLS